MRIRCLVWQVTSSPAAVLAVSGFAVMAGLPACNGQQPARLEFEAASIKPHPPSDGSLHVSIAGGHGRISYTNVTVRALTKEVRVYSLVVAKGGAKLTAHTGEGDSSNRINNGSGKASVNSTNVSMASFAGILAGRLDRVVIDDTGLKGGYDLKLEWAPNPAPDSAEPSLFTALREQLGLKLESAKGPVEIIVIDNIERPSEN